MTRLVVGLGNPGPEYARTRHNVGFHVVERIAAEQGLLFQTASNSSRPQGEPPSPLDGYTGPRGFEYAAAPDGEVLLLKPLTFMNRSGQVVGPLARHLFGLPKPGGSGQVDATEADPAPAPQLLVVYDDLDLDLARLRIRHHGSAGGQNGMRSIIEHLGTDCFPRLRVGIGRPGTDAARHVLSLFSAKEQVEIDISIAEAAEAILDWLDCGDLEQVMTRFHSRWNQDGQAQA